MEISRKEVIADHDLKNLMVQCTEMVEAWAGDQGGDSVDISITIQGAEIDPFAFAKAMWRALDRMAEARASQRIAGPVAEFVDMIKFGQASLEEALENALWDCARKMGDTVGLEIDPDDLY